MNLGLRFSLAAAVVLVTLSGCGRGFFQADRAPWRHEAEVACLKSGVVKLGVGVERIDQIDGPGACGADFPLRVTGLGEVDAQPLSFADDMRPPASVPRVGARDMPRWPASSPRYVPPAPVPGEHLRWVVGPPAVNAPATNPPNAAAVDAPQVTAPAGEPMSIVAPTTPPTPPHVEVPRTSVPRYEAPQRIAPPPAVARAMPSDIPPDAIIPKGGSAAVPEGPLTARQPAERHAYNAPIYEPEAKPRALPRLGPGNYSPAMIPQATLAPPATLACPLVSALDRWVSEGVQPAALHWFGVPVTSIKQIGSYACRSMVGASTHHISEHAFGNALDIASFTFADERTVTVKDGWHGSPEEQGFLHDVQLYACETFTTVLAPGYNPEHYNHIHVDLMRRRPGYRPCRPTAIRGEIVAARVRAHYANRKHAPAYTGSISGQLDKLIKGIIAVPGADGYVGDDDDEDGKVEPAGPSVKGATPRLLRTPAQHRFDAKSSESQIY